MTSPQCLCVITGASRGFGQAIVEAVFKKGGILECAPESTLLLIARSEDNLQARKVDVLKSHPHAKVDLLLLDLSNMIASTTFVSALEHYKEQAFAATYFFSNAGVLGDVTKSLVEQTDCGLVQKVFTVNITVPVCFISAFCRIFAEYKRFVVNTSSLGALKPFAYAGHYSTSKAAMDMFCRSLATENSNIRVLSYAPGPMATLMAETLRDSCGDGDMRKVFSDAYANSSIIQPGASVEKLMWLLSRDKFESGEHIDFYDVTLPTGDEDDHATMVAGLNC